MISATPPATQLMQARMESKSMGPTAIWCSSSLRRTPTFARMSMAADQKPCPFRHRSRPRRGGGNRCGPHRHSSSPGAKLGGLDEGPEGPDLYRYLVSELNKLGLAYVHVMPLGDERSWPISAPLGSGLDCQSPWPRAGRRRIGREVRVGRSRVLWSVRPLHARFR